MFLIHTLHLVVNSSLPVCPLIFKCYENKGPPEQAGTKKADDDLAEEARRKPWTRVAKHSSLSHWLWVTLGLTLPTDVFIIWNQALHWPISGPIITLMERVEA